VTLNQREVLNIFDESNSLVIDVADMAITPTSTRSLSLSAPMVSSIPVRLLNSSLTANTKKLVLVPAMTLPPIPVADGKTELIPVMTTILAKPPVASLGESKNLASLPLKSVDAFFAAFEI
jgi:hypothetical protein